jgi:DNA (cytosine-5)-methyltransferase 1
MNHGSLFSGIGGFDLAASGMNWENKFHCDKNYFCQKILKKHFPSSISYGDIKTTDFTIWRNKIDILSGGFPCQPYSIAGKRKGIEDERHLWPEMLRAIREIQPGWIVGENVRGLINWDGGLVFDQMQADLEANGYETLPFLLPACAVNAWHRRDRIWFIAYSDEFRRKGRKQRLCKTQEEGHDKKDNFTRSLQPSKFGNNIPTSRILRSSNGISAQLDRIVALGNAVVPQLVFQIFKAIDKYEKQLNLLL